MTPTTPQAGPNPAQIHNSIAQVVLLYGALLDQQQRLIDLLQQQLVQARKVPLEGTKLGSALEEREKYFVKAAIEACAKIAEASVLCTTRCGSRIAEDIRTLGGDSTADALRGAR